MALLGNKSCIGCKYSLKVFVQLTVMVTISCYDKQCQYELVACCEALPDQLRQLVPCCAIQRCATLCCAMLCCVEQTYALLTQQQLLIPAASESILSCPTDCS